MPRDTPSPSMDPTEEFQNNQILDEDDFVVIDEDYSDLSETEDFEAGAGLELADGVTFHEHHQPVFCCDIANEHGFAVSGGQDDKAYIWDMSNGKKIFECTGHEDSVTHVAFNHDSSLVATGDMAGIVQVWDVHSRNTIWDFQSSEVQWLQWLPGKNVLLAGMGVEVWLWQIPEGITTMFPVLGGTTTASKVIDEERFVVGYEDGAVRIWDVNNSVLREVGHLGHKGSITSFDINHNGLILSGSVDGSAKLIKPDNGKVLHTFHCGNGNVSAKDPDSVESVAYLTNQPAFVAATVDGTIVVWDIGSHAKRFDTKQECGVVKVVCRRDSPVFYTAGLDGILRLYDGRTGDLEASWRPHALEILDFCLSSDGQRIVTASEDGTCKVLNLGQS